MLKITGLGALGGVISNFQQTAEIAGSSVEVGVLDADQETAMASEMLEHRWQGAGPAIWRDSPHTLPKEFYVNWAFCARTAKTIEYGKAAQDRIQGLIDSGATAEEFWNDLGKYAVDIMKKGIKGVDFPPNTPLTVERKGKSDPLVDEGDMLDAIDYRIVDSEGEKEPIPPNVPPFRS